MIFSAINVCALPPEKSEKCLQSKNEDSSVAHSNYKHMKVIIRAKIVSLIQKVLFLRKREIVLGRDFLPLFLPTASFL